MICSIFALAVKSRYNTTLFQIPLLSDEDIRVQIGPIMFYQEFKLGHQINNPMNTQCMEQINSIPSKVKTNNNLNRLSRFEQK